MDYRENHHVNIVSLFATTETGELNEITVVKSSRGETARGYIYLDYENVRIQFDYDTVIGPDGLRTVITGNVGDEKRATYDDSNETVQVTEHMYKLAQRALASVNVVQNYSDSIERVDISDLDI